MVWKLRYVQGHSMAPTLLPGDRLLMRPVGERAIRPGDILCVRIKDGLICKRLVALRDGGMHLEGDNQDSSVDSRDYGLVPVDCVESKAVLRYWPPWRWGRVGP